MADNKPTYSSAAVVPAPVVKFADGDNIEYSPVLHVNYQAADPVFLVYIPSRQGCEYKLARDCQWERFETQPN